MSPGWLRVHMLNKEMPPTIAKTIKAVIAERYQLGRVLGVTISEIFKPKTRNASASEGIKAANTRKVSEVIVSELARSWPSSSASETEKLPVGNRMLTARWSKTPNAKKLAMSVTKLKAQRQKPPRALSPAASKTAVPSFNCFTDFPDADLNRGEYIHTDCFCHFQLKARSWALRRAVPTAQVTQGNKCKVVKFFGWGTWIRTRAARVRAESSTAKLSPNEYGLGSYEPAINRCAAPM